MDLYGRAWRSLLRGLREGDPMLIVAAGLASMVLWLRRHPRERVHLVTHEIKEGRSITVSVRPALGEDGA